MKSGVGGAWTTSVTVAAWVSVPLDPVIVSVDVPAGVAADVEMSSVAVPLPFGIGLVDHEADAYGGRPLTARLTAPENPPLGATVTEYDTCCPAVAVWVAGDVEIEKSGAAPPAIRAATASRRTGSVE